MNEVYEANQTSGYSWGRRGLEQSVYHLQKPADRPTLIIQASELANLDEQMTRYEAEYQHMIGRLRNLYVLEDEQQTMGFLNGHRSIPQLLVDAEPQLRRFFQNAVLSLRTSSDDHGWEMLYVLILWAGGPDEAIRALDSFDDAWWLAHSYPAGSSLTFTYRLV